MTLTADDFGPHVVFLDTETTGLDPTVHELWEVALIVQGHRLAHLNGRWSWMIRPRTLDAASGEALRIGRFYSRITDTPLSFSSDLGGVLLTEAAGDLLGVPATAMWRREHLAAALAVLTEGATFIANNAHFDARFLEAFMREEGVVPAWDYRVIDVVALAAGFLSEPLPWRSEQLSKDCNVDPPTGAARHTARGDAEWVQRWWEHLIGADGRGVDPDADPA